MWGILVLFVVMPYWINECRNDYKEKAFALMKMEFKEYMLMVSNSLQAGYSLERALANSEKDLMKLYEKDSVLSGGACCGSCDHGGDDLHLDGRGRRRQLGRSGELGRGPDKRGGRHSGHPLRDGDAQHRHGPEDQGAVVRGDGGDDGLGRGARVQRRGDVQIAL